MASKQFKEALLRLKSLASAENAAGMARFGINGANTLGISKNTPA